MSQPFITRQDAYWDRVRMIDVPPDARALSTLARIDYADAFLVDVGHAPERTAEQWARAVLEDAPAGVRIRLRLGWSALGLKLGGAPSDRSVLGWEIRRCAPEFVLLCPDSARAIAGELLFKRGERTLLFCTFVQHRTERARDVWARVEPTHAAIVHQILEQAYLRQSARISRSARGAPSPPVV